MPKKDLFVGIDERTLAKRKKGAQPGFVEPMLATLTDDHFSSKDWIYEHKFDGERCLVIKKDGHVSLLSRSRRLLNVEYPDLMQAFNTQDADDFIIDGEIVALGAAGVSDFQMLQSRMNRQTSVSKHAELVPVQYHIFDVMYAGGYDIRDMPLLARKAVLKKLLDYNNILMYTEHRSPDGLEYFKEACNNHWEGLIAKKSDSTYVGERSKNWLKFKCLQGQELVIGGYTDPKGSRTDFGALLVGYYDGDTLKYAGKVGTGYDQDTLEMLGAKLRARERKTCPFSDYDDSTAGVHWVTPELVADFKFAEWTKGGKLRVGRYKGLRDDKAAKDVVKEIPKT